MRAVTIANGSGWDFVLVGEEVYRVRSGWSPDSQGFPMGARWECSQSHWLRYRGVYDWAQDISVSGVGGDARNIREMASIRRVKVAA